MKKQKQILIILIASFIIGILSTGIVLSEEIKKPAVKYPDGYRDWTHVKSMVIQQGHPLYDSFGGIHHIYANQKALESMKSGKPYPDGAVLIFDLLEAKSENNSIVEGPRKVVGVMQKDSKKFANTGGWGFEGFKGDTKERVVSDPKGACFACHEAKKQTHYVFSDYRK